MSLHGLYVITDPHLLTDDSLIDAVAAAIAGGARLVQYRDKRPPRERPLATVATLRHLCRAREVTFLINDDIDLAALVAADGVHLGREDVTPAQARRRLGSRAIIGLSCYNELGRARAAGQQGADYIAFGRFFPSRTKPDAVQADPGLIRRAREETSLPVVAIGGITPENGGALIDAGAAMLAVIEGVFGQPDIEAAARRYAGLFGGSGQD